MTHMFRLLSLGIIGILGMTVYGFSGYFSDPDLHPPLDNLHDRPALLTFGLYVTPDPEQNPIDPPERFSGYHVATDYEIVEGEEETDVPVYAVCSGYVTYSGYAGGYGGLLAQRCFIEGQDVVVLYGHVRIDPLPMEGEYVYAGTQISYLANAGSYESGETRKHLHLGMRKGKRLDLRGYVQTEEEVANYLNPAEVLKFDFGEELEELLRQTDDESSSSNKE